MRQSNGSLQTDFDKAIAHRSRGNHRQAENILKRLLKRDPGFAAGHNQLGSVYQAQGKMQRALRSLETSVRLEPKSARYRYDLANALKAANRHGEAIAAYEQALALNDRVAEIHNNLGTTLLTIGDTGRATECFNRAISCNPALFEPHLNLGNIHRDRDAFETAIDCYKKAIELNPQATEAYNNLGHAYLGLKDSDRAIGCFERALELDPDLYEANANLKHQQDLICDWRQFDERNALLDRHTKAALAAGRKPPVTPFQQLTRSADPELCLQIARAWSAEFADRASGMTLDAPPGPPPSDPDKIKLGYLSVDFRDHPVGHIVERLFAHHDRERFIVTAYSIGCDDESDYRARIAQNCDRFVDLRDLTDLEAANRIRADGTNVLIDLTGFTEGFRMGIMALKPAPVQASYLGFPGTTGAAFIDYLIADAVVCPPQDDAHYQESVVRLPASYMLCPYRDLALGSPPTRASAGLKDDQIVFCSFNQMYKIDPVLFDAWMAIVRAVDNSVLWLPDRGAIVQENLRREAEARKVAPDRIVFSERCDALSDHLSRLRLADIALDTRLYNGHVTTIDALFAGVPVITAAGDHFPSRAAASILQAAGLPDLVANDLDEYCATAIALARSPKTLESVRDRISGPSRASPIFDPAKFAGDIESAFDVMWRNHVAGNDPAPIEIR